MLAKLGLIAVTNPNGAGRFSRDFTREQIERWFKGRPIVYALENNDPKGRPKYFTNGSYIDSRNYSSFPMINIGTAGTLEAAIPAQHHWTTSPI